MSRTRLNVNMLRKNRLKLSSNWDDFQISHQTFQPWAPGWSSKRIAAQGSRTAFGLFWNRRIDGSSSSMRKFPLRLMCIGELAVLTLATDNTGLWDPCCWCDSSSTRLTGARNSTSHISESSRLRFPPAAGLGAGDEAAIWWSVKNCIFCLLNINFSLSNSFSSC